MRSLIFLCSVLLGIFLSCNPNKDCETFRALQGDWTDGYDQSFLFNDTLCNYLYPFGNFTSFKIRNDTIVCTTKYPNNRKFKEIKFHILRLDGDSLEIEYKMPYTKKKEKLLLSKVKNKSENHIKVDSIVYFMNWDSNLNPISNRYIKTLNDTTIIIKNNIRNTRALGRSLETSDTISLKNFVLINEKFAVVDYKRVEKNSKEYSSFYTNEKPQVCIYARNELNNYKKTFNIYNLYKSGCIVEEDAYPIEFKVFMSYADNITLFIK